MIPILITGTIAITSLSIAVIVAIRSRNIFAPRLRLAFGRSELIPKSLKFSPRLNIVAISEQNGPKFDFCIYIHVHNDSKRKISDVAVEINYPRQFKISNSELSNIVNNLKAFANLPRSLDDGEPIDSLLDRRKQITVRSVCRSRYDFGTLRPGEGVTFFEPFRIDDSVPSEKSEAYDQTIFNRVCEQLTSHPKISAAFRVNASVLCDLSSPSRSSIDVVVVAAKQEEIEGLLNDVVCDGYWLSDKPFGRTYFRPSALFFEKFLPQVIAKWQIVINLMTVRQVSISDGDKRIVASYADQDEEGIASSELIMPGFDIYSRRYEARSTDEIARTIGYMRVR